MVYLCCARTHQTEKRGEDGARKRRNSIYNIDMDIVGALGRANGDLIDKSF